MRSLRTAIPRVACYRGYRFFKSGATTEVSSLPVLDKLAEQAVNFNVSETFKGAAILGVQHILGTTVPLVQKLLDFGVKADFIHLIGKPYSTSSDALNDLKKLGINQHPDAVLEKVGSYEEENKAAIRHMLSKVEKEFEARNPSKLIILDEGFKLMELLPHRMRLEYPIAGIEQTRAGLYSESSKHSIFPIIEVASSAVKKLVEPPMIAKAVVSKLEGITKSQQLKEGDVCGVVGNGVIGAAIAKYLLSKGLEVMVYDSREEVFSKIINKGLFRVESLATLASNVKCIFGCTGRDISCTGRDSSDEDKDEDKNKVDFRKLIKQDCTLVSCSSGLNEYASLLKEIGHKSESPLQDIKVESTSGSTITIVRGGFPVNFDNSLDSVPPEDIQITRGLLLAACIQAAKIAKRPIADGKTINKAQQLMLDPYLQQLVIQYWLDTCPDIEAYPPNFFEQFFDSHWVQKNSGGEFDRALSFAETEELNAKKGYFSVCKSPVC